MRAKNWLFSGVLSAVLTCSGVMLGQASGVDIGSRHPNLAEAQRHIQQAYQKIEEAQKANKERLGGHAEKAKELLAQASRELKVAAEYANRRH